MRFIFTMFHFPASFSAYFVRESLCNFYLRNRIEYSDTRPLFVVRRVTVAPSPSGHPPSTPRAPVPRAPASGPSHRVHPPPASGLSSVGLRARTRPASRSPLPVSGLVPARLRRCLCRCPGSFLPVSGVVPSGFNRSLPAGWP